MSLPADSLAISEIALRLGCELVVPGGYLKARGLQSNAQDMQTAAGQVRIQGIAPLGHATSESLSFLANPKYLDDAKVSAAGAILCSKADAAVLADSTAALLLVCQNPYASFARISQHFFRVVHDFSGRADQAWIDQSAVVACDAVIFPFVFIGSGARVEEGSVLYPGVFVGAGSVIGKSCILYPNSVVQAGCVLGAGCILNPGAVIGGDGFGFAPDGNENVKIPQIGGVRLGKNVEVGANSSVDRGTISDTVIGDETKIDSLVQVGHNVTTGRACFLAGQCGIAGSTQLGDRVTLGGQVAVTGHINLASGVTVLGKAGVSKSLTQPGLYNGIPALPNREYLKREASIRRLIKKEKSPSATN